MSVDLVTAVLESADRHGDAPAITFGRRTLSYAALAARVRSLAARLVAQGMKPGDRVLFSVRPGPDAVVLAVGIVAAGGTVVFADPGAGEALFRARAALAAPRWVAAESLLYLASSGPLRPIARRRGLELAPYGRLVPEARHIRAGAWLPGVPRGALSLDRLMAAGAASGVLPAVGDQEALIIFTSGTTGAPKAVVHGRLSLGTGLSDFAEGAGIRVGQRVLSDQLMVGIPALIAGAHWTMPPAGVNPGAEPEQYLRYLPETELLYGVPAAISAILHELDARPELTPPHLEAIVMGGAPVLRPLLERIAARFPEVTVRAVYGMTELLPVAIADGAEKLAHSGEGDFVGRLVSSVSARIDQGELVLTGPGLARGFLADLPDHPLTEVRTGDLARIDGDRLTLLGRTKDMFIRGTQNVYPGLYEPLIAGLPGVEEVAMVGIPDAIGDDRIVVAIVPTDKPSAPDAEHPVARSTARALPGLIDAGVLPDCGRRGARTAALGPRSQARPCGAGRAAGSAGGPGDTVRVAVTGASGFVGGAVATALAENGHEVVGFGRRPHGWLHEGAQYRMWDLLAGEPLAEGRFDAVVHCAALADDWASRDEALRVNRDGTLEVIARFPGARLVHMSTSSVYDALTPSVNLTESATEGARYLSGYSESKALAEVEAARFGAVILRPHAVYGPGDTTLLPRVLDGVRRGRLVLPEGGDVRHSLTHIDNLVYAVVRALDPSSSPGVYNIADAHPVALSTVLEEFLERRGVVARLVALPYRAAFALAAAAETAALVNRTRPRLTRYAVSQLGLERTFDLTAARTHLDYQPTPTTLEGAENW